MTTCTVKQLIAAIFLLQISLLSTSCRHSPEVRRALRLAGNNRGTFEKVLQYYSRNPSDSLKLKAAVFLIGNMSGHYSYREVKWQEDYYNEIETVVNPQQTAAMEQGNDGKNIGRIR
jgi:hypothetical protein